MISAYEARQRAFEAIPLSPAARDPLFSVWSGAALGEPQLVCDVFKNPSYWVIPVLLQERVIGFVLVLGDGRVARFGALYRDPLKIDACPRVVTAITEQEALNRALERVDEQAGEAVSQPVYVHDGPPGREAWLVEVLRQGKPTRWIFVTAAFIYERPAGELLPARLE